MSALPAASKTLFGCQSTERTVDRIGFFSCLAIHQLFSGSKEQTAIALWRKSVNGFLDTDDGKSDLAPLATANLSSFGLHRTKVAALFIRSSTSVGFHTILPVGGSGDWDHTYALRSCDAVTIRFEFGAQSMDVMTLSCLMGRSGMSTMRKSGMTDLSKSLRMHPFLALFNVYL